MRCCFRGGRGHPPTLDVRVPLFTPTLLVDDLAATVLTARGPARRGSFRARPKASFCWLRSPARTAVGRCAVDEKLAVSNVSRNFNGLLAD